MPRVWSVMDTVRLVRTSTGQEDTLGRRPPENKRQSVGDLHRRPDLLV